MGKIEELEREIKTLKTLVSVKNDEVFTTEDVAKYLKIAVSTVHKLAKAGNYRILKSRLIEWINKP